MTPSVPSISPLELKQKLEAGAPLALLDVREEDERAYCRILTSDVAADLHIPMRMIPEQLHDLHRIGKDLVVYCHHGVRSHAAAQWLLRQGVANVINLDGGIDAWSILVDPKVRRY